MLLLLGLLAGSATATGIGGDAIKSKTVGKDGREAMRNALVADTDGDGIPDLTDLDDDNDGILDTVESACNQIVNGDFANGSTGWTQSYATSPSTGPLAYQSGELYVGVDNSGNLYPNNVLLASTNPINYPAGYPMTFKVDLRNFVVTNNSSFAFVLLDAAGNIVQTIETYKTRATGSGNITISTTQTTYTTSFSVTTAGSYRLGMTWVGGGGAVSDDVFIDNISVLFCDTDGDGIPNSIDTDSDGDGCPDAVEGGAAFTISGGQVNGTTGQLTGSVSSATATYGVPTIAGAGQTIGYSQNSAINACTDTDGDGIANVDDLDDDNDGILDTVENYPNCNSLYNWVEWTSITSTSATGTLSTNGRTITVSVSKPTGGLVSHASMFIGSTFPAQYGIPAASLALGNSTAGAITVTFSSPINVPLMAFGSLGNTGANVPITFATPYTVEWNGQATVYTSTTQLSGNEGYGIISFPASSSLSLNFLVSENYSDLQFGIRDVQNCLTAADTDGDGIPNSLDLDSDGDGCPDAIEGGATFTTANLSGSALAGAVSSATATYGVPVIAGTGQSIGYSQLASVNACTDTDGDGIANVDDLDDDNDGILDTAECLQLVPFKVYTYNRTNDLTVAPNVPFIVTGQLSQTTIVNQTTAGTDLTYGGVNWKLIASNVLPDATGKITVVMQPNTLTTGSYAFADAVLITNGISTTTIIDNNTSGYSQTGTWIAQPSFAGNYNNNMSYVVAANYGNAAATWSFTGVSTTACDTDGDGIANNLDLDSDADGCPDAIEGAATFTASSLVSSTMAGGSTNVTKNLPTPVGSTSATMGVPTIAGTGQSVLYSQNAAVNACTDTDGDGVADIDDLDDDNDGILDTVEGLNCVPTILTGESNGTFGTISAATRYRDLQKPIPGPYAYTIPTNTNAGQYVITSKAYGQWFPGFTNNLVGHTTGLDDDAYLLVNGATTVGTFYSETIAVGQNTNYTASVWTRNWTGAGSPAGDPTIALNVYDATGTTLLGQALVSGFTLAQGWVNGTATVNTGSNTQVVVRLQNVSVQSNGNDFAIDDFSFKRTDGSSLSCTSIDTDGDGIPDYLDLDSDADGCPDAVEGGAAFTTSSLISSTMAGGSTNVKLNLPTPVGSGTATMGVPTIAGTGQTIGVSTTSAVNGCTDTDGDGIADIDDLDDDNDGILDTVECVPTNLVSNGDFSSGLTGWTNGGGWIAASGGAVNSTDDAPAQSLKQSVTGLNTTNTAGTIKLSLFVAAGNINSTAAYLNILLGNTTYGQFRIVNGVLDFVSFNGATANITPVNVALNTSGFISNAVITIPWIGKPNTADLDFQFTARQSDFSIDNVTIQSIPACDTDGDGIPNYLDLDSDADGCPDAIEGGAAFTVANLVSSTMAGGSTNVQTNLCNSPTCVGSTSATMGVPTIAGTGQTIGTSQNSATKDPACCLVAGITPTLSATTKTNTCPATTIDLSTITASNTPVSTTLSWHTGTPATAANRITNVTSLSAGTYYAAFFDAANNCYSGTAVTPVTATTVACCQVGTTAPALSATSKTNACPLLTIDLSTITASNAPAGTMLTWHTGTPATAVNRITTITAVAPGTYYAAFYDATNNCYSGAAVTPVTASTVACCQVGTSAPGLSVSKPFTNACPATNIDLSGITASNTPAGTILTWHTGNPATAANRVTSLTAVAPGTYYAAFYDPVANCYSGTAVTALPVTTVACCQVGSVAPALSTQTKTNTCPATTIDLSTITSSNTPAGIVLTWHTGNPATAANRITSITSVPAGIYYAAFYDATANCYSNLATTAVFATTVACCQSGNTAPALSATSKTNNCPATTIDLSTITASNTPAGTTLTWHTGTPATTANRITAITAVAPGTYYAAFFDATNNCFSGTGSAVTPVTASTVACCPNPSVGGSLTLVGTLPLCSVSNQGVLTLSGQTGAVVKWQTSTNGGLTWIDIPGTAGLTQYSFMNAQNNQQFRAVVNAGGSCTDANSTPFATLTSASACSVDCDVKPGGISKN